VTTDHSPTGTGANGLRRRDFLAGAGAGLLAPAIAGSGAWAQSGEVNLTLWSWVPRLQRQVDLFQQAHPNIKVQLVNAGQSAAQYVKLRNALKAGTGAPDVCHMEYAMVPSFRQANALVDLSQHGASQVKEGFVPWTWQQVSDGNAVYALPWDSGPLGLIYRVDMYEKYGVKVPATWDELAEEAMKYRKANPDGFLVNAEFANGGWANAMFWQAGARPYSFDGTNVSINLTDARVKRVAEYWQKLLDAKAVDTKPIFTTEWYTALNQGRTATWISAAWGPLFLSQFAKTSSGQWRSAPIPQWGAGEKVSGNWGGSTMTVINQTKHAKEAAQLAIWMTTNPEATKLYTTDQFLFPTRTALLESAEFRNTPYPFYGGQTINEVFIDSSRNVDPGFRWSPFQDYVNSQLGIELSAAASGKGTLVQALDRLQDTIVRYAKAQGFTVRV
jgi:multiple sugar transport system substrate-binding protein